MHDRKGSKRAENYCVFILLGYRWQRSGEYVFLFVTPLNPLKETSGLQNVHHDIRVIIHVGSHKADEVKSLELVVKIDLLNEFLTYQYAATALLERSSQLLDQVAMEEAKHQQDILFNQIRSVLQFSRTL